jgi:hypothetical protein
MSNITTTTGTVNQTATLTMVREAESLDSVYRIVFENRTGFDVDSLDSAAKIADAEALLTLERIRQANFEEATRTLAHVVITERSGDAKALAKALLGVKTNPVKGSDKDRQVNAAAQKLRRANGTESLIIPFVESNGVEALTDQVKKDLATVANTLTSKDKVKAVADKIAKTGKMPALPKRTVAKKATSGGRSGKVLTPQDRRQAAFDAMKATEDAVTALLKGDLNAAQKRDLRSRVTALGKTVDAYSV